MRGQRTEKISVQERKVLIYYGRKSAGMPHVEF